MRTSRTRALVALSTVFGLLFSAAPALAKPPTSGGGSGGSGGNVNVSIQGFDAVSKSWTSGNTAGYAELQAIPFRLPLVNGSTAVTVDSVETIYSHCDTTSRTPPGTPPCDETGTGVNGIDDLEAFQLCNAPTAKTDPAGATGCVAVAHVPQGGSPPASGPYVEGPRLQNTSGGVIEGVYTWRRIALAANSTKTLRWGAILALGSHAYGGASLHMKIGNAKVNGAAVQFGSKDVPIPVNQIIATETDKKVNGVDGPINATVGDLLHFSITATTFGPRSQTATMTITDDVPACLAVVDSSVSPAPPTATIIHNADQSTTLRWVFPNTSARTTRTVTFDATLRSKGACENVATTEWPPAPPSSDTVVVNGRGTPDPSVEKDCPDTASPGEVITCEITVTNVGDEPAPSIPVFDDMDSRLDYQEGSATRDGDAIADPSQNTSGNTTTLSFGTIALDAGESTIFGYDVRVPATQSAGSQTFSNTARVTTTTPCPTGSNDCDTETVTVTYTVDLRIAKECGQDVGVGDLVTHTLRYGNDRPASTAPATNARIVDVLGSGLSWQGNVTGVPASAVTVSGQQVTFALGTLAPGQTGTITYRVRIESTTGTSNTATISSDQADANTNDNSATCSPNVRYIDLLLTKACPAAAQPGATVRHTLTYGNAGNTAATGVTITDTLGAGLTWAGNVTGVDPSDVSVNGQVITFDVGTVAAGASGLTISYDVTIASTESSAGPKQRTDSATIAPGTGQTDINSANNSAGCSTTVNYQPELTLDKTVCPAVPVAGGTLTYTFSFANTGSAPATNATLRDTLPDGEQFVAASNGGALDGNGDAVWSIGTLTPGETGSEWLQVLVTAGHGAPLADTATLSSDQDSATDSLDLVVTNGGAATTGSAYALDVRLGSTALVNQLRAVSTSASSPSGHDAEAPGALVPIGVPVPGIVSGGLVITKSQSDVSSPLAGNRAASTSSATVADLDLVAGRITAKTVQAVSESTAGPFSATSSSLGSTFQNLSIDVDGDGHEASEMLTDVQPNAAVIVLKNALPGGADVARVHLYEVAESSTNTPVPSTQQTVTMIRVELLGGSALPGAQVTVARATSDATYPSGFACGTQHPLVSGRAFTAFAHTPVVADVITGEVVLQPNGGSEQSNVPANVPGVVTVTAADNRTNGEVVGDPHSQGSSTTTGVNILNGMVTAELLAVTSTSDATASTGTTSFTANFVNLRINGTPVNPTPGPNTVIALPPMPDGRIVIIVLNEREESEGPGHTAGTINAVHVLVFRNTALETEVIVASAHSDAHASSA